jgi:antitoxin VapB
LIYITAFAIFVSVLRNTRKTAKLFRTGRSQAVRLPAEFRFEESEVFIRKDPVSGDVILSRRPDNWDSFLEAIRNLDVPKDFLSRQERHQKRQDRDPFKGWTE